MRKANVKKIFGENVKHYRKKMGLSQEELAEKLGISPNHMSVIERGDKFVSCKLLEKLISVFNVTPSALFYAQGLSSFDDSAQSQINKIIKTEMDAALKKIAKRISEIK